MFFEIFYDLHPHRRLRVLDRRNFQHSNEPGAFIILAVQMAPGVGAFRLWVIVKIENLNIPMPDSFALKDFMDRHG
ncbi:MAG: hypothetical protein U1F65_07645 [Verrucomicrobiota bacterium]